MARTIAEIKKEMTDAYISNSIIRDIYGITGDADFDSVFSPVSIESTLFYIFAATAHVGKSSVSCPLKPSDSAPLC